ncbi:MAG: type pilus assembly protein PilC [Pseudomonadota bacterium]|jgi:type IV pilus assembly protein PilC|nr:type pilus assembly protein PilC [Pseudomonadota bacterium]
MALYAYKAVNAAGKQSSGEIEAANPGDLELRLSRIGLDLITYDIASRRNLRVAGGSAVKRRELITFCFHLEQLTRAGVPLLEGLADLRDSIDHPRFKEIVADLIDSIEGGAQLSQALAAHPRVFDPIFINLIKAGESTGKLPEVLKDLMEGLKWQDELASQAKKAVMYPAFVLVLVVGVALGMIFFLVPQMVDLFAALQVPIPVQVRVMQAIASFLTGYWYLLPLLPLAVWGAIRMRLRSDPEFAVTLDGWKLKIPGVGPILHKIILARFANYFGLMFSAGISVLDALKICEGIVHNKKIERAIARAQQQISEGAGIAAGFESVEMFPKLVVRMLKVGESTGQLDQSLQNICYFYNRDVRESIEKLQVMIEPVLTVILGGLMAIIMVSILGPIFDLMTKIK